MMTRAPKHLDAEKLLEYGLRTLSGQAQSLGQLRQKLQRRADKPEDIDTVMLKLKDAGYLNDRKFAENFAASRLNNDGLGQQRVMNDLRQRRVAPKLAQQVVAAAFADTDETELIEAFLARKYRGKSLPEFLSDAKNLASAFRRLRYAGFSPATSIRVLKRYAHAAEELEGMDLAEPEDS